MKDPSPLVVITSPEHIRRTREGIARARASGKRLGRPPAELGPEQLRQVEGLSTRQAAAVLGCTHPTVLRARRRCAAPADGAP